MLGPMLLLTSTLTSASPSPGCTASGLGLPDSWGLTLTLGWPLRGTSQGAWRSNTRDWGPLSSSARLTLPPRRHPSR